MNNLVLSKFYALHRAGKAVINERFHVLFSSVATIGIGMYFHTELWGKLMADCHLYKEGNRMISRRQLVIYNKVVVQSAVNDSLFSNFLSFLILLQFQKFSFFPVFTSPFTWNKCSISLMVSCDFLVLCSTFYGPIFICGTSNVLQLFKLFF